MAARPVATGAMKTQASNHIRRVGQMVQQTFPEMMLHQHYTDAARELSAGRVHSAQRHLHAAIFGLTPQQVRRHGIHDDGGHERAKSLMQESYRGLLLVKDIEDIGTANDDLAQARREAVMQAAQDRALRRGAAHLQSGASPVAIPPTGAAKPATAGPPAAGPAKMPPSVQASGGPPPQLSWEAHLRVIELVATPHHETAGGRRALQKQGKTAYGTSYPVPNVSYLHKALRAVGRVAPGKRQVLKRFLQKRARQLGVSHHLRGTWADPKAAAVHAANPLIPGGINLAHYGIEDSYIELARSGPFRYRHGWIRIGSATEAAAAGAGFPGRPQAEAERQMMRSSSAYRKLRQRGQSHSKAMQVLGKIGGAVGRALNAGAATEAATSNKGKLGGFMPGGTPKQWEKGYLGKGPFGKHLSKREAAGFADVFGGGKRKQGAAGQLGGYKPVDIGSGLGVPLEPEKVRARQAAKRLNRQTLGTLAGGVSRQTALYRKLRAMGHSHQRAIKMIKSAGRVAANPLGLKPLPLANPSGAASFRVVELRFNPLELRDKGGQWRSGEAGGNVQRFAEGKAPGSLEHVRSIMELASAAEGSADGKPSSDALATSLRHLGRAVASRDMRAARVHLDSARWANDHETGGAYTPELADLARQLRQVPSGVQPISRPRPNPLLRSSQHPGRFRPTPGPPLNPTRGALRQINPAGGWTQYSNPTELSARTAMLERTPAPRGKPGGPGLYDVKGMGHTPYLQQIVKALIEKRGMPPGKAYAIARGAIRKWGRGGGHVHPEVRAAAARAEGGELERQARAKGSHGHANDSGHAIELFNPAQPRVPAGAATGGQFAPPGSQPTSGKATKTGPPPKAGKQPAFASLSKAQLAQLMKAQQAELGQLRQILAQLNSGKLSPQAAKSAVSTAASAARSASPTPARKGAAAISSKGAAAAKATAAKPGTAKKTTAAALTRAGEAKTISSSISTLARQIQAERALYAKL